MIDVNVSVGPWPFQSHRMHDIESLLPHLRKHGIRSALISHLGGVFAADPHEFNLALAERLKRSRTYHAVPIVNAALNGWQRDLVALPGTVRAIRILPAYHNYSLKNKRLGELMRYCSDRGIPVCLQVRLDDERTRYFGLRLRKLNVSSIVEFAQRHTSGPIVLLNQYLPEIKEVAAETSNTYFDTSFAEWLYTVEVLLETIAPGRLLFGSHAPLLETRACIMKVFDSTLATRLKRQVGETNARRLFRLP